MQQIIICIYNNNIHAHVRFSLHSAGGGEVITRPACPKLRKLLDLWRQFAIATDSYGVLWYETHITSSE